jgi:hypothetical protein
MAFCQRNDGVSQPLASGVVNKVYSSPTKSTSFRAESIDIIRGEKR